MAFEINGKAVTMNEGDYGTVYNVNFNEIPSGDTLKFIIKKDGNVIVNKEYTNIVENKIEIKLTRDESLKLNEGVYEWGLLQYRKEELHNTLIKGALWKVEEGL